jgi:hypothetical protein
LDQGDPRADLVVQTLERVGFEALDVDAVLRPTIAGSIQLAHRDRHGIQALGDMPRGVFALHIDPRGPAGRAVQTADQAQLFFKCVDPEEIGPGRKPLRKDRLAGGGVEPFVQAQTADLGEPEIDRIPAPVGTRAVGKASRDIGDAVQIEIGMNDRLPVAGENDILLQKIRTHRVGHRLGRQGVLGQVCGGAAAGDDDRDSDRVGTGIGRGGCGRCRDDGHRQE